MELGDITSWLGLASCAGALLGAGYLGLRLLLGNTGGQLDNSGFFEQLKAEREAEQQAKPADLPGGDLPAQADAEFAEELKRRFGSQPEPTKPVILYPSAKRRITPED